MTSLLVDQFFFFIERLPWLFMYVSPCTISVCQYHLLSYDSVGELGVPITYVARQEDDEAVLCIVCAFCQLISHEDVKVAISKDTRILTYFTS